MVLQQKTVPMALSFASRTTPWAPVKQNIKVQLTPMQTALVILISVLAFSDLITKLIYVLEPSNANAMEHMSFHLVQQFVHFATPSEGAVRRLHLQQVLDFGGLVDNPCKGLPHTERARHVTACRIG
jgi:hypothetical protein